MSRTPRRAGAPGRRRRASSSAGRERTGSGHPRRRPSARGRGADRRTWRAGTWCHPSGWSHARDLACSRSRSVRRNRYRLPRAINASWTVPPGKHALSWGTTRSRSKKRHEKMSKYARSSSGNTWRLTWLSAIIVIAERTPRPSVKEREERVHALRPLVGVDVEEKVGPEVGVHVGLGVLEVLAVHRLDRRDRAREDRLEDAPEAPGVEGHRRHEVGEVRLAEREGVEGEVAARQEDERADPAVLRHDPVVVREHERGHHRLEPELGRDLLEHLLDQRDVVEAGAEPLEAVYREVEHSPPSFERAGRVSFGDGSTRTVERTGALASAGSAATS